MFTGSVWRRGLANGQLQPEADQPAEHPQGPEHRPQEPGGQLQRCDNGKSRGPGPDTGAGTIYSIHHAPVDDDLSSANDTRSAGWPKLPQFKIGVSFRFLLSSGLSEQADPELVEIPGLGDEPTILGFLCFERVGGAAH